MYYLKCTECGGFNVVKTEFQTFCNHCGQKLSQNFTQWKKTNPRGTFAEYQNLICLNEQQKSNAEQTLKVKPRKKISKVWLILGIFLLFFLALGVTGYLVQPYIMPYITQFADTHQEEVLSNINKQNWETYACGSLGLSLQSPIPLQQSGGGMNNIPDEYKQHVEAMEIYTMENPIVHLSISATSVQYVEGVQVSVVGARDGVLEQLRADDSNVNFKVSESEYELNSVPGILTSGSFISENSPRGFQLLTLSNGLRLWQIFVMYDSTSKNGKQAADKVIESAKLSQI